MEDFRGFSQASNMIKTIGKIKTEAKHNFCEMPAKQVQSALARLT